MPLILFHTCLVPVSPHSSLPRHLHSTQYVCLLLAPSLAFTWLVALWTSFVMVAPEAGLLVSFKGGRVKLL